MAEESRIVPERNVSAEVATAREGEARFIYRVCTVAAQPAATRILKRLAGSALKH